MAEKSSANIGFERQLWNVACVLWGHIPAAQYRNVIIGLIFLRYVSAAFDRRYEELVKEGDGFENDRDAYTMENVFYVPEEARWAVIAAAAHTPEIGNVIDRAMEAIEQENTALKNVLPKNYGDPSLDKNVLGDVVDVFTNHIDMSDAAVSEDLLGRTYEYCIAQFAAKEGVKGGEFYTPASIVKTLVAILKPFANCKIYDCCCGSGGMFVQSEKFIEAHGGRRGVTAVYGQEANSDTWKMAKINMAIRGIEADLGSYQADTFTNDLHPYLKADFILANPPFNYHPWGQEKLQDDVRWKYGLPPKNNANFAWIQHMIHHLKTRAGQWRSLLADRRRRGDQKEDHRRRPHRRHRGPTAAALLQCDHPGDAVVHHQRETAEREDSLHRRAPDGPHGGPETSRSLGRRDSETG